MVIPYTKPSTFTSFDKTIFITTLHQRIDRIRTLEEKIIDFQIPRGAGLSYVPASFGENTLVRDVSLFNRILEFDAKQKTVIVESGITLKKLLEWSLKEKLFLPVQPGYPEITVGGCIAANAHGKNPLKYGSFKEWVMWLEIFHPKTGFKTIVQNSEFFDATCGGLGLTGIITRAKLQLHDLPSDRIIIETKKVESLLDSVEIFEKNSHSEILMGWHNGSTIKNFEKGFVQVGTFAEGFTDSNFSVPKDTSMKKPYLPISFWNKYTSSLFNSIYRYMETNHRIIEKNVFDSFFPIAGMAQWFFVLYGKNGFREYQVLISKNNIHDFIHEMITLVQKEKPDLHYFGLKPFRGIQKFLQYCKDGLSITLDFNNSLSTSKFLEKLDNLAIEYEAIPYIIKDSRLPKKVVEKCYPEYEKYRNILKKIDPDKLFRSKISQQLDL